MFSSFVPGQRIGWVRNRNTDNLLKNGKHFWELEWAGELGKALGFSQSPSFYYDSPEGEGFPSF